MNAQTQRHQGQRVSVINLPKLRTSEDESAQAFAASFDRAAAFTEPLIFAGPLMVGDHPRARLSEAVDDLAGVSSCSDDECQGIGYAREMAAYRIGLLVGLKLGRTNGGVR